MCFYGYFESSGIGQDDGEKYLKLYGLLQAVILQQDSIRELYGIFVGENLISNSNPALENIRQFRNLTAGHPIEKRSQKGIPQSEGHSYLKSLLVMKVFNYYVGIRRKQKTNSWMLTSRDYTLHTNVRQLDFWRQLSNLK